MIDWLNSSSLSLSDFHFGSDIGGVFSYCSLIPVTFSTEFVLPISRLLGGIGALLEGCSIDSKIKLVICALYCTLDCGTVL